MSTGSAVLTPAVRKASRWPKVVGLSFVFALAVYFVSRYALHYLVHITPQSYFVYWTRRGWVFLHVLSGTVALLIGPFQFSRRLRQRSVTMHRVVGRVYLIAILCAAAAALDLAATTPFGLPWAVALASLAVVWLVTAGMAYSAIRMRQIQLHKEWMIRSYVVTFAFVTFRILLDTPPFTHLGTRLVRGVTYGWASWAIPLLATEVIFSLRRMRNVPRIAR